MIGLGNGLVSTKQQQLPEPIMNSVIVILVDNYQSSK